MERLRSYVSKRPNGRWRAVYDDPETHKEVTRHFRRKVDAEAWLDTVKGEYATGTYINPAHAKTLFQGYADGWAKAQIHRATTADDVARGLRLYTYPTFGQRTLGSIKPSEVQAWVKGLPLAPSTVHVVYRWFASIMLSAVHDELIRQTPCRRITLPKIEQGGLVVPLDTEQVWQIADAMPILRDLVIVGAGTGLRQGELLGLTWDRIDWLRRSLRVDRQLVNGVHGPCKTSASVRNVPLPEVVIAALSSMAHRHDELVFVNKDAKPWQRNQFSRVWRPAVTEGLGIDATCHDLRHYYASLLIYQGASVKTVQRCLGHSSATITLDTYGHLWPDSEDEVRRAVDSVLRGADSPADSTPARASDQG